MSITLTGDTNTPALPTELVRCPLCGEDKGYTLGTADTYRWWTVCCGACGRQVDECRSNSNTSINAAKPLSWPAADEVWNQAGALAEALRAKVQAQALQILALTGEVAELAADAGRFRWLAGNGWAEPAIYATGPREWGANGVALLAGPQLADCIDGAMAESKVE